MTLDELRLDCHRRRLSYRDAWCMLPQQEATLLAMLIRRRGMLVSYKALIGVLYGERDGVPMSARRCLSTILSRIRSRVRRLGIELCVSVIYDEGFILNGLLTLMREAA